MSEEDLVEMRQNIAFSRITAQMGLQMLLRMMPTLAKQGVLNFNAVETMHRILLHEEQNNLYSADDRASLSKWRQQLEQDAPQLVRP